MLVTAREAAEILDMKVNSIYMAASQGRLKRHLMPMSGPRPATVKRTLGPREQVTPA